MEGLRLLVGFGAGRVVDLAGEDDAEDVGHGRGFDFGRPSDAAAAGGLEIAAALEFGAIGLGEDGLAGEGEVFVDDHAATDGFVAVEDVEIGGAEHDDGHRHDHEGDQHLHEREGAARAGTRAADGGHRRLSRTPAAHTDRAA